MKKLIVVLVLAICCSVFGQPGGRKKIRNIIYVIGDGMGPQQISLLLSYAKLAPNSIYKNKTLFLEKFFNESKMSLLLTHSHDQISTDSACSATQLATGHGSNPGYVGMNSKKKSVPTILELAKKMGKSTGLISDVRVTHATLASFAAHVSKRKKEDKIAKMIIDLGPDVLLSGGLRFFIPSNLSSAWKKRIPKNFILSSGRKDQLNLLDKAQEKGYQVVFDKKELLKSQSKKILGLFSHGDLQTGLENSKFKNSSSRMWPTLSELTGKGLDVLDRNKKGFFLVVEAGQIDFFGHRNDVGSMLHEMIKFEDTLQTLYNWAKNRKDTLILILADHETGNFAFAYSRNKYNKKKYKYNYIDFSTLDMIYRQKKSFSEIYSQFYSLNEKKRTPNKFRDLVKLNTGITITLNEASRAIASNSDGFPLIKDFAEFYPYGQRDRSAQLARVLASRQGVTWGTATHTATPVYLAVWGPIVLAEKYPSIVHMAEVGKIGIEILQFRDSKH